MKRLFISIFTFLALLTTAQAQTFPICNWGDLLYRASTTWECVPYSNTAGPFLQSQGPSAPPVWTNQAPSNFLLPTQAQATLLGNVSGGNASPTAITPSEFLDVVAYDTVRPQANPGTILYRGVGDLGWQKLEPGAAGQTLVTGGLVNPPYWAAAGTGSVTSVALSVPAELSITGSPITTSGTIGLTWTNQTANKFLASPNGSSGLPSFRAIEAADITAALPTPAIYLNGIGSTQGQILYQDGTQWNVLNPGTSGQVLKTNGAGANPTWTTLTGTGTVTGPVSSTVNAIARWNDTGGVVIKDSPVTVSDTGVLTGVPSIVNSGTLTLPTATDTLVGRATTDTLTNKTFDTAGTGNVFRINGTTITANTGTGSNVLATSPTLVTPALGVATATSINKVALTAPATGSTLTIADGKTATFNETTTFSGGAGATITFQGTGTVVNRDSTDTLTSKTISGASNTLSNIGLSTLTGAAGTGTILRANGTNWVATTATYPTTTTVNQLLWSNAANTITGLATVNGGLLNAGATGIPALTVTPTLGVAGTSRGTIGFSGNTSGVVTVQPAAAAGTWALTLPTTAGTANQFLRTDGAGITTWADTQNMMTGFTGTVSTGNIAAATTNYLVTTGYTASEGGSRMPVPIAMKITGMALSADNTPGGVQTYTYTLMVNGGASAMTCTTTGAANTCSTSSNTQTLAAGDTYAIRIVTSATATAASHKWGISYTTP